MAENKDYVIKVSEVSKDYGKFRALDSMSFTVPKGSIYGLVGRNGAGKTTIMRVISGLQKPTSGTVEYGFDHKKLGKVGALVELPSIYSNQTARENLVFQYINLGLKIDGSIEESLNFVGLGNTGKKKAGKFSLGMRQRLGIAMAMSGNPEVLILDEPINGLDPQGIIQIRDLLIRLNREKGVTIIISSHILSELSKLATDFAFVEGGKVVKEIKAEDLEDAGGLVTEFYTGTPERLIPVLNAKGLTTSYDPQSGIVYARGYYNLTNIVLAANDAGANIARVVTKETDLETYFVKLVGGESNA
ncbi:ATP-binding cassette domain-containing protein [Butyrivibrio sp. AE2032]|uniref:ATP-binding cassette domain-containing protein n=1 Tax=Butyrivibrio sp. AE2032 TaxID=1458463 RepID=UPI0005585E5D|nr:ATP-binding cassette domain-containing protein [Butyrivibrio sp. AE2032]